MQISHFHAISSFWYNMSGLFFSHTSYLHKVGPERIADFSAFLGADLMGEEIEDLWNEFKYGKHVKCDTYLKLKV